MKKKALALLLAAAMAIQPLSVAGAAEFTDGQSVDVEPVEVFTDDAAEEPVVEEEKAKEGSVEQDIEKFQIGDNVWMEYEGNGCIARIRGNGATWDYKDDGWDVTGDHRNPCMHRYFENVIIEEGITHIGDYLFYNCSEILESLTISESVVSIGKSAFENAHIGEPVILPKSLTTMGENAFANGGGVFMNVINNSSLEVIPKGAFSGCYGINEFDFANIKEIGDSAFYDTGLTSVNFSDKLTKIGDFAFGRTNITKLEIPKSVISIGEGAFWGCTNLKDIELPDNELLLDSTFYGCSSLRSVVVPLRITALEGTFGSCTRLNTVTIKGENTRILTSEMNGETFNDCTRLDHVEGMECSYIHKYAIDNGIKFVSLEPKNEHKWSADRVVIKKPTCTELGESGIKCNFCGIVKDKKLDIPMKPHDWSNWTTTKEPTETTDGERQHTCLSCGKVETAKIPKLSPIKFESKRVDWQNYDKLSISVSVNKPVHFYVECKKANEAEPKFNESKLDKSRELTKYISVSISSIPEEPVTVYLFVQDKDGNSTYTTLEPYYEYRPEKPETTIQVGDNVYATIEGNTLILAGSGATYDNLDMFMENYFNIDDIQNVVVEEGITGVGNDCFSYFTCLENVQLPTGLKTIGSNAFYGCSSLTDITIPSTIESVGESAFAGTSIKAFIWPSHIRSIPAMIFMNTKLAEFTVPNTVTEINHSAFECCTNLIKITIPESVKYIGDNVFRDCRNLTIYGDRDSVAERYAYINNIPFVSDCFKVIFKEDGRTKETEYVKKGENATPPTLAPRPGYTLSWDADYTNITEDMVINAVWTKDGADKPEPPIIVYPPSETKYTVTFKDRGKVIKTEKVVSGEAADFPYISRYGYELSWDKDFSKVTSNMTVNAVWTVIKPAKVTSLTGEALPKYARLSWDRNEYTDYYLVYRKAAADKEFKQVAKTTRVLWNDKKVKPGNEYQYKVVAVGSVEGKKYQGEYSDTVTVKIGKPETGDIYSVGKLNYKITNSNEVRVIGLAKNIASLSIPTAVSISGKPYKVTSIDHKAFYRNENLVDVKIGNNVNYIGKYSFYQCPNLESVKFGGRVQTISTCAFTQCPKLGNVVLPSSVERLGAKAFFKCTSMRIMTVKTSRLNYLGTKAFAINPKITIRVPKSKYSAYVKMIKKSGKYAATKFQKF